MNKTKRYFVVLRQNWCLSPGVDFYVWDGKDLLYRQGKFYVSGGSFSQMLEMIKRGYAREVELSELVLI